jgi:tetratricopeptide (TPR) repeat protein
MINKAKIVILALIAVILIAAGIGAYFLFFNKPSWDETLAKSFLTTGQLQDDYDSALAAEEKIEQNPSVTYNYVQAGFYWKSIADATKEEMFYQRALDTYLSAIKNADKSSVVYTSAGNIYRVFKKSDEAEEMYRKSLEMTPGEAELYIRIVELYRYDMNKNPEDILAVYEEGFKRILSPTPLLVNKATYLRDIGRKDEAIKIFEDLFEQTQDETYYWEIEDIKASN